MRTTLLLTLAMTATPVAAAGQSVLETIWSDVRTVPGDMWHVYSSPARMDGNDAVSLAGFAGGMLLVGLNDQEIQDWVHDHSRTAAVRAFEPFSTEHGFLAPAGQNHVILRYMAGGYVVGLATGWDGLREAALGCAVGNTTNALVRKLVYRSVARTRPGTAPDDPYRFDVPGSPQWDEHSFFGGHAANAFTCATFWAERFDLGGIGEPLLYAAATGVAVARTVDDAHWMSDTLIGMGFGWAIGRMLARRYAERAEEREGGPPTSPDRDEATPDRALDVGLLPVDTPAGPALLLSGSVRF